MTLMRIFLYDDKIAGLTGFKMHRLCVPDYASQTMRPRLCVPDYASQTMRPRLCVPDYASQTEVYATNKNAQVKTYATQKKLKVYEQ
jgi:hypothetical protein